MIRNINSELIKWKSSSKHKPLIVRGARQVGKTYTITKFSQHHFKYFVKLDFEKQSHLRTIFEGDLEPKVLIEQIEIAAQTQIIPGETLLFFDEIQHCPRALMALRYFFEDMPELHVIAAGSLLEFQIEKISFPTGRVDFLWMYPLSFAEFLQNTGQEKLKAALPQLSTQSPLPTFIHQELLKALKSYFLVGGMPEAVVAYQEAGLLAAAQVHEQLTTAFLQDVLKYETKIEIESVQEILETIPRKIGQPIKYTELAKDLSIYKTKQTVSILERALLIHKIRSTSAHGLPLGGQINRTTFKYSFVDIGLMQHICGISATEILQAADLMDTYQGALCEQFVAQEVIAQGGSQSNKLYYWLRDKKGSQAEVDLLIVKEGKIVPIEIKKGAAGRLKSLHLFLSEHPDIDKGYVFNAGNIGQIDKLCFCPLYTQLKL